jgi:UDP-N-acetylmuramate--alanine ligase
MRQFLQPGMSVHLIGIGGIGMSAIARVLHGRGLCVSGSDQQATALTRALTTEGIVVRAGHHAEWVLGADLVLVSSAISADNPEVIEARRRGLPVVKRDEILGELTADKTTIAVAGTHGKTTTSAMIAWILTDAGFDPTFIVGGVLQNLGTNARSGSGPHFVIEADEYDRAFLGLQPQIAVITALEHDHPDCYPTLEDMRLAFSQFADQLVAGGLLIVCGEDPQARDLGELKTGSDRRVQTYGLDRRWDWWAEGPHLGNSAVFEVGHTSAKRDGTEGQNGKRLGSCALQVPGRHNVLNALAALAASTEAGIDFGTAASALTRFRGTARRFEVKGHVAGITVVDDYAHHPTEIRATLAAARIKYPGRPIWAVFQPHTYSRTAALLGEFGAALVTADHVIVTAIYAAREWDTLGMSGQAIVDRIPPGHPDACYVETLEQAVSRLLEAVRPGDLVITLGAGDGYLIGDQLLEELNRREARP